MEYQPISAFEIFKIGVGPSSSHTLGPWRAAQAFVLNLEQNNNITQVSSLKIKLYGSLAKTGIGHGTDVAVQLGICGEDPVSTKIEGINDLVQKINTSNSILLNGVHKITFCPKQDIEFHFSESLPFHPNALTFLAVLNDASVVEETYYSTGGGFIVKEGEQDAIANIQVVQLPFPIGCAADILHWCRKTGMPIHEVVRENEMSWKQSQKINEDMLEIWKVMQESIYAGCHTEGLLPGGLQVKRRAGVMNKKLLSGTSYNNFKEWINAIKNTGNDFTNILNFVSCFALAVNEVNASFGRVVTAPTNGAAGVIPAVLLYYFIFCKNDGDEDVVKFLLTAAEVGCIFKKNATISAAMGGCQAEIGVSSAMAAAALTEAIGGTQPQALMAAEIAMEHHLGLTCDPIAGLVQIPCIERNTMGAIKAITSAQLAMQSTPDFAKVSLDGVIETMWQTAKDMNTKYKETADGGLAVHIPISLSEC